MQAEEFTALADAAVVRTCADQAVWPSRLDIRDGLVNGVLLEHIACKGARQDAGRRVPVAPQPLVRKCIELRE